MHRGRGSIGWTVPDLARAVVCGLRCAVLAGLPAALVPSAQAAAPPPAPVQWRVARMDDALRPEGGTFRLTLAIIKPKESPTAAGGLTLTPSFADGWGRRFWEGPPVAVAPGDKDNPATVEFTIPYPPLPPGGYVFTGRLHDAAGNEVHVIRVPTGRMERFDFRRDLAWMIFGCNPGSDAHAQALREIGFNGAGGYRTDYRFPYRWFQDHAVQIPTEGYPEAAVLHPEGTPFAGFRTWFTGGFPADGGLILALLTEEIGTKNGDPAMRAARLRLARADGWMKVPTLGRFNAFFQTDFLSWDEVFRDGFPPLNHPRFGGHPIAWTADRQFRDVEAPMMRAETIRATQPAAIIGPGATHGVQDANFDSMNRRAYNNMATLDFISPFLATQKNYGLRPGSRLFNLKAAWIDGAAYFPAHEHLYWAALAVNDRLFLVYCPGDGYGSLPVTPDGEITDEGAFLQGLRRTIHGLRPVILETRSRVEPAVFWASGQAADPNLADALAACGVVPTGGGQPDAATRLIFAIGGAGVIDASLLAAARDGAGLVLQGSDLEELADLGIEAAAEPAADAAPEKEADDNEGNAEALTSMESTAGAATTATEIDLSPLAGSFPGLAGVKVLGNLGSNATAKAGSGLQEIRAGGRLLAITGPLGKGWVLFLNVKLQNMILPTGWRGSWGASNLSLLGDASVPERNAGLVRALLARAGVPEPFRIVDEQGKIHPFVRAFAAEPPAGGQRYLYVVSESAGRLIPNEDPKKVAMTLAHDREFNARLQLFDPAIKAVRDLRTGKMLPVQADGKAATVELALAAGQGTILSLLPAAPAGPLPVHLSQSDVADGEQLHVAVGPRPAGHTCWVRFLNPEGREVEPLSRWATGPGPHVFTAAFAVDDPEGEWTVVAEDMTDGTRAEARFRRQAKPAGPRFAFTPDAPLVRGTMNRGRVRGEGLTVGCDTPGVRASLAADGQLGLDIAPDAPAGPAFLALRRGESAAGGLRVEIPEPFTVAFASTPYLDGDLIVTEIRGVVRSSLAAATPVTIRGAGQEVTVNCPAANQDVPFAIPLFLTRARAQALCGLRHEGVAVTLSAPGVPAVTATWKPNILPLQRAPQRVGSVSGGTLAVRINNFTPTEQRIAVTLAALPGETAKPWQASATVAPHGSATVERSLPGLPAAIDPGLHDVALDWTAGGVARERAVLPVEEVLEQEWWINIQSPQIGKKTPADDEIPTLPPDPKAREQAGWRRVVTQSVLWWNELAPPKGKPGRLYAAAGFEAPQAGPICAGFTGPCRPAGIWINGDPLEFGPPKPAGKGKAPADPTVMSAAPIAAHQGENSVVFAVDLPLKTRTKSPGTSLVLQDPATGRRDRSLKIGERAGDAKGK